MYAKSLIGIEVTAINDKKYYGYIYSPDDLSDFNLYKAGLFLLGLMESEIQSEKIACTSVFTQDNSRLLFRLLMSEPIVIRQYSSEELTSFLHCSITKV